MYGTVELIDRIQIDVGEDFARTLLTQGYQKHGYLFEARKAVQWIGQRHSPVSGLLSFVVEVIDR
jgi:hypothetical protein